jgi:transcriptional regulator with XRE-family HTH domain
VPGQQFEGQSVSSGQDPQGRGPTPRIGRRLRAARARKGLELQDVERALCIRSRHLRALEAERFDELPEEAYARAFLREYADHLGLKGEELVRAFDARLALDEPVDDTIEPELADRSVWLYVERVARLLPVSLGALMAGILIAALALVAWQVSRQPRSPSATAVNRAAAAAAPVAQPRIAVPKTHPRRPPRRSAPAPAPRRLARLVLTPTAGDCWLLVRAGTADGRVLYEGTVHPGGSVRFARERLWIRTGAPWNLAVRLNGRLVGGLPKRPDNVVVTAGGLQAA